MNTWLEGVKMLQHMQNERPEKADDQGLAAISKTLKSLPVGCDFTIKKGGAMNCNFILRVARHLSEINGLYFWGNGRHARSILLPCLELQDHQNYVHISRTMKFECYDNEV